MATSNKIRSQSPPKPRCPLHQRCDNHDFKHGGEAEELRKRFETLMQEIEADGDTRILDHGDIVNSISRILEDVDARDSLAFLETGLAKRKSRKKNGRAK